MKLETLTKNSGIGTQDGGATGDTSQRPAERAFAGHRRGGTDPWPRLGISRGSKVQMVQWFRWSIVGYCSDDPLLIQISDSLF